MGFSIAHVLVHRPDRLTFLLVRTNSFDKSIQRPNTNSVSIYISQKKIFFHSTILYASVKHYISQLKNHIGVRPNVNATGSDLLQGALKKLVCVKSQAITISGGLLCE